MAFSEEQTVRPVELCGYLLMEAKQAGKHFVTRQTTRCAHATLWQGQEGDAKVSEGTWSLKISCSAHAPPQPCLRPAFFVLIQ